MSLLFAFTAVAFRPPVTVILGIVLTVRADILYSLPFTTSVTCYSWFSIAAVMLQPKEAAPEKVTKSLTTHPWFTSVTAITGDPFVAAKVTSPADVVNLIGVISL